MTKIDLQGISNARDLGGIATPYGTVAAGRLIRSGEHSRMTDSDSNALRALGLARVIDLRTDKEMANVPDRKIEGVTYTQIPIIPQTTFGISYESSDGPTIAAHLQAGIERMRQRGETPEEHMCELYSRFATNEFCKQHIGQFVQTLAHYPTKGATLWHCSAGKDRVGVCTATLLHCLGATKEQIIADYMLTNTQTETSRESVIAKVTPHVTADKLNLVKQMLRVEPHYIGTFFAAVDSLYGSMDGFVAQIGVTAQDIALLRAEYLVK